MLSLETSSADIQIGGGNGTVTWLDLGGNGVEVDFLTRSYTDNQQ